MKHVYILGSRGLPAKYGGFETFVEALVTKKVSDKLVYHVACLSEDSHQEHFDFAGVDCFTIKPPKLGAARVIAYDVMAFSYVLKLIKKDKLKKPIVYMLGNTIGAFVAPLVKQLHKLGGRFLINPDGLEWKRSKWSRPVQIYLKYAERAMTRVADLVVADNAGIETYIKETYPWARTTCIAYGTETEPSHLTATSPSVRKLFDDWKLREGDYYLIVGRFVPENNYQAILEAFMASNTKKDLVLVCNHAGNPYFNQLRELTGFDKDKRIKFIGTIYDRDLLTYLREQAYAYLHGHEVGGTNPGLLEALAHTEVNLVLGVSFNREVAKDTALYWQKEDTSLTQWIDDLEVNGLPSNLGDKAKRRIQEVYSWEKIVGEYEALFLDEG